MSKWSIRSKMIAVVTFLLVAMGGIGAVSVRSMQAINAHTIDIATSWLPRVRELGELRAEVNRYRAIMRDHMLAQTAEGKEAVEKKLASYADTVAKSRNTYEAMIASAEERELYENWSKLWERYLMISQDVMALSRKNLGSASSEAPGLFYGQGSQTAAASDEILERDINLNKTGSDRETAAAADGYSTAFYVIVGIVVAALLGSLAAAFYLVRDVSNGIASIVRPMELLGRGDLTAEVPHRGEKTEIGSMADALQIFKEALIAKKTADEATARDAEAKIERGRRVDAATRSFETMIGEIVDTVSSASTELEASAATLTATAERAQELTAVVVTASEEASTNVQSVASATEELSASITEISRQVQESARMANGAVDQAGKTNDRVSELSRAAARIGDVVELINTIAGQTNLLALNATIEAARAGEAGRGFAVVASEVKALAEQTAKATGEIGHQVSSIQAATQDSVGAIRDIGDTIEKLSEIASTIAAAVEEQGAATQEISRNVQQAAQGTGRVASSITGVQNGASETGSASAQVLSAARSLASDSTRLKAEVRKFLESVKAA